MIYFLYDYVFPGYFLPNALESNHAMLNYMHSQHNISNGFNAYTDPSESNISRQIFNNQLGDWPNSWTVTNLNALEEVTSIKHTSLFEGKQKCSHYFYVVKISPHLDQFAAHGVRQFSKLNGNYFWKYMSQEALEDAQNKKCTIILDLAQENYIEKHEYENLHKCLESSYIPPSQIILVFNTHNGHKIYDEWFEPHERKIQVRDWPFVMWNSSKYYSKTGRWDSELEKSRKRPFRFLMKIKSPRNHRQALLYSLYCEQILDRGDWSYLSEKTSLNDQMLKHVKIEWSLDYDVETESLVNLFPKKLADEPDTTMNTVSAWTDRTREPYRNSYFYICTETYYHGDHKSLTEKVFKPIGNYHPFFFFSFKGALQHLRDLGFKTFSPWIDESYDNEKVAHKRLKMIVSEVKRLCEMSEDEIYTWYWEMQDILEHNREHLIKIYESEPLTKDFVNFLEAKANEL